MKWPVYLCLYCISCNNTWFVFTGNEARHFTLKDDTVANRDATTTLAPPTYDYVYINGTNISYVGKLDNRQTDMG